MPLVLNEFNCVYYEYPCKMSECRFNQWTYTLNTKQTVTPTQLLGSAHYRDILKRKRIRNRLNVTAFKRTWQQSAPNYWQAWLFSF